MAAKLLNVTFHAMNYYLQLWFSYVADESLLILLFFFYNYLHFIPPFKGVKGRFAKTEYAILGKSLLGSVSMLINSALSQTIKRLIVLYFLFNL